MAVKVKFEPFEKVSRGNDSASYFSFNGEDAGSIIRSDTEIGTGFAKVYVVADYTVSFFEDASLLKDRCFVVEANPSRFSVSARTIQNQRPDSPVIFVGPFAEPRAALSAAKEWVRTVARGEGRDP